MTMPTIYHAKQPSASGDALGAITPLYNILAEALRVSSICRRRDFKNAPDSALHFAA